MMGKAPKVSLQRPGTKDIVMIECSESESILKAMVKQEILYRSDCDGRGTCGKCRIRLITGKLDITIQDKKIFTPNELKQGFRLSCQAYPREDCEVLLLSEDETNYDIISENRIIQSDSEDLVEAGRNKLEDKYIIGIDLGTTTLAVSLVNAPSKKILRTYTAINNQRIYGLDVISRMKASNEGKRELLRDIIRKNLLDGIQAVIAKEGIEYHDLIKIVITGNTTMGHLLLGYSCETLGVFPFTPIDTQMITMKFSEIFSIDRKGFESLENIPIIIMPGISTFVGGDIVAGLFACGFDFNDKPSILIDLGTNGEMAIGCKDSILVTSTAAGPAFEGGNISGGVGSIAGAISHVSIESNKINYQTIGDKDPIGICGTGVVEIVSELFKEDIIDETGLLTPEYFEEGYIITDSIRFTQKDIRELQLAKAAVRAGVEILTSCYGTTYEQIDTVYLAGGFGYRIDLEKAIHIGLLPEGFRGKIISVGNSALAGAIKYGTEDASKERINHILSVSKEIYLSNQQDFNNLYMEYMYLVK